MKYLATAHPDLILVDFGLPIVNGVECIWMIKQLEHLKNTHVVLCSAPVSDSTAGKAIRFGATLCMEKTSDMNKLVAQLDDFFLAYFKIEYLIYRMVLSSPLIMITIFYIGFKAKLYQ